MERSIETIWKEGFLSKEALVAPKLNDLYNKKSVHTVDKLLNMGKTNLLAIVAGAVMTLAIFIWMGAPIAGSVLFLLLLWLVWYGRKRAAVVGEIDKGQSSYHYLKSIDHWLNATLKSYGKIYRFFYPAFIISFAAGMWYSNVGQKVFEKLIAKYPDMLLTFGIPTWGLVTVGILTILSSVFAMRIYRLDIDIVYGRVLQKLNDLINDMEELRH